MANDDPGSRDLPNGSRGTPSDPSWLTTQQLRETETQLNRTIVERIAGLRELVEQRLDGMDRATELLASQMAGIPANAEADRQRVRAEDTAALDALRGLLEARLAAMDKATELLAATVGKVPSETDKAINALRELLSSRIDGMDTATKLLADSFSKFPSDVDRSVGGLKAVMMAELQRVGDVTQEKFTAIDGTFQSNALALTAALAAQKEAAAEQNKSNTLAITKSESSTKETISANAAQAQTANASLAAQVTDIKERVVRIESTGAGITAATGSPYESAVLQQNREASERTAQQAERQADDAREAARTAQARAVMALVISGILLLVSLVSVVFAITKKLGGQPGPVIAGHAPAGREQGQFMLASVMETQRQCPRAPGELHLPVLGSGRGGIARGKRPRDRFRGGAGPPGDARYCHVKSRYRARSSPVMVPAADRSPGVPEQQQDQAHEEQDDAQDPQEVDAEQEASQKQDDAEDDHEAGS
jgi:hypothetical protein